MKIAYACSICLMPAKKRLHLPRIMKAATCTRHESSDLYQDRMLLLALVKCIDIIGEAASKVSSDAREEAPDIPWPNIVAMRNRLIHGYFDINPDIVWRTVDEELPRLIIPLARLLEE